MRDPSNKLLRQLNTGLLKARFFWRRGHNAETTSWSRHHSCPVSLSARLSNICSEPGVGGPARGLPHRAAALLLCAVSILGAAATARAQNDQPVVSIAAPALAAGTGGHLFEIEGDPKSSGQVTGGAWVLTRAADGNGGYEARTALPSIRTMSDTDAEGDERLILKLEYSASSAGDIAAPATRSNIPDLTSGGSIVPLAGSSFIAAVLTIADPPPSDDATLSVLKLTDTDTGNAIGLDPSFARDVLEYAAEVAAGVQTITLEATANHSGATLKYMNGKEGMLSDMDLDTDGFQVGVMVGTTVTKVQVEAEIGTKQIYSASVTRQGPPFSLTVDTVAGDDVVNIREKADGFTVSGDAESEEMGGVAGASVTVVVGTETLTATSDNAGLWSVSVPPNAPFINEPSVTVTVNATGMHSTVAPEVTRTLAVDLTAPTIAAVTVEEDRLTLTYDETLGENGVPPSAFSISVNGVVRSGLMAVAVGGTDVVLALTPAVTASDTVTLSYTAPAPANGRPIQDAAGNEVQSLTDHPVTNNTESGERCAGAEGSLRLVDGNEAKEGRVEVCADDDTGDRTPARWGVVCDDYWTNDDADVVCKALDYERSEPHAGRFRQSYFGAGTGPIWLDDLLCDGDETSLLDCLVAGGRRAQNAIGEHNCRVTEVVGVRCMAEGDPLKPHLVSLLDLTEPGADGTYEPGDRVRVTVAFNEAVVVDSSGGTPTIGLNLGDGREFVSRAAPYLDGSGTNRLGFEYRVVATDGEFEVLEVARDSLATSGGTIRNAQGLDALLGHGSAAEPIERFLQSAQLSVSDATAQEGSPVVFEVSLSRSASNSVAVDYRTADGTATAGADYVAASGTLSFAPGETAKTVSLTTLDDAHDEGEETLTLVLSDARGAQIADGNATGRIVNSDPLPRAWLARFGRTAADHAVEAIGDRLRGELTGSSFIYSRPLDGLGGITAEPGSPGTWSAWGQGTQTRFSGAEGELSLNGEVTTATLGADAQWGRWLTGAAISYSEGKGAYTHETATGGALRSTLASLHPYANFNVGERLSLWGVLGYGVGELTLSSDGAEPAIVTGLTSTMAAFGGRGLLRRHSGGFELAVISDALLTNTVSEATSGLLGAEGEASRVRLMLEGSGTMHLATGGMLRPTLEAGLRYDRGDAETGAGVEIGGGLAYDVGRLSLQVDARRLLAHEDTAYGEWGFSGSLRWQPAEDGRGWSMNAGSSWGVTQSGVDALWNGHNASGLADRAAVDTAQRFQAELGYGLIGPRGRGLWYPFLGAWTADGEAQSVRMGLKLTSGTNVEMALEIGRRMQPGGRPDNTLQLRGEMRW